MREGKREISAAAARASLAAALLVGLGSRVALAEATDPYLSLRGQGIDRILVTPRIGHTPDDSVLWINDVAAIQRLLAPLAALPGGAHHCGYHRQILFFKNGQEVERHVVNTRCGDYVREGVDYSTCRFQGELLARWQPYLDQMNATASWWDLTVSFPASVDATAARAAIAKAGLEQFELSGDALARLPWLMITFDVEVKACDNDLAAAACKDAVRKASSAAVGRLIGSACDDARCQVGPPNPSGWLPFQRTVLVTFPSNRAMGDFKKSTLHGKLDIIESRAEPPQHEFRAVTNQRPTAAVKAAIRTRIAGATQVEARSLRASFSEPEGG